MGGPAALALVMAGVGRVIIAHGGRLDSPDLNRQVLGCERILGEPRAGHFAEYLRDESLRHRRGHRPRTRRRRGHGACPASERRPLLRPTFEERLRLNRAAVRAGVPLVDAAQWGMTGTLLAVDPGRTACLQCIYPAAPEFEEMFPVVGAISAATGSLAALEAIKILSGAGRPASGACGPSTDTAAPAGNCNWSAIPTAPAAAPRPSHAAKARQAQCRPTNRFQNDRRGFLLSHPSIGVPGS